MKQCLQVPHASGQGSAQEEGEDSGSHRWGTAELALGLALNAPRLKSQLCLPLNMPSG